jgi:protocatechuate 3,4-dioxygenase beta subunit
LEGTVVNAVTGEPLKKVHLTMRPLGAPNGVPYGTMTDNAGHFLMDDVDPGRYNFAASRNGFVTQTYSAQGSTNRNTLLTLTNGNKLKEIVFKLTPQGVISGRILDEDGEPLANVAVQCLRYGYQRGRRQLMGQNGGSTDDLGEFRLFGMPPGKYVISATYRSGDMFGPMAPERTVGTAQSVQAAEEGYATTYYPNTTNAESASALEITPGAHLSGINMTLARIRTVRVKGRVNGAAGEGRRNIMVMLLPRDNSGFGMPRAGARSIDGQGNFQLRGVAPGSYILRANFTEDNKQYSARLPLEVGNSNIEGIELELQPPADIEGRIVVEENGDLKGANLQVFLQTKAMGSMMGGGGAGLMKDDRTFKLTNVSRDPYDINVFGLPEGFYLKSVRFGDQDVTETGVDFTQGVSAGQLTIVLNPNGGQVDGAVQNAKGDAAVGATVTLIPDAEHRSISWMYKTANTDQNGHFTIKGVRPGEYKIYAWEDLEPGAPEDPDFVKPHESAAEAVSVKESSHETVQLKVVPAENSAGQQALR